MEFVKLVGPFGVFFIMFALGLNLSIKRFLRVFSRPKNFIVGLMCQVFVLPIIADGNVPLSICLTSICALLQYCFLLFYLGNMKLKK